MSTSARRRKLATIVIPALPVRNPLAVLAKQRNSGKHEVSKTTERRKAARAARIEAEASVRSKKD
jgi:hypothetical protein